MILWIPNRTLKGPERTQKNKKVLRNPKYPLDTLKNTNKPLGRLQGIF